LEVTQAFLPYLRSSAAARVINILSGYGRPVGMSPDVPGSCLSKPALCGFTVMPAEAPRR
jgi:NAD(P)-dependent dehydrogenase (short-subunit alcohol dehydrogenase family)